MDAPIPLGYPSPLPRRRRRLPGWVWLLSVAPPVGLAGLACYPHPVRDLLRVGQGIEVLTGTTWMAVAAMSLTWLFVFAVCDRPGYVWACAAFHGCVLGLTIFPGVIVIPWLMHWLSGPGA